jgi:hypothetical protein
MEALKMDDNEELKQSGSDSGKEVDGKSESAQKTTQNSGSKLFPVYVKPCNAGINQFRRS